MACRPKDGLVLPGLYANPDLFDKIIIWHLERDMAQRQWTIQLRMDFADNERNEKIDNAFIEHGLAISALGALLSDGQKPNIMVFSDDWQMGRRELDIFAQKLENPDPLAQANAEHGDKVAGNDVSDELAEALANMGNKPPVI